MCATCFVIGRKEPEHLANHGQRYLALTWDFCLCMCKVPAHISQCNFKFLEEVESLIPYLLRLSPQCSGRGASLPTSQSIFRPRLQSTNHENVSRACTLCPPFYRRGTGVQLQHMQNCWVQEESVLHPSSFPARPLSPVLCIPSL